ncbi:hypothetical protein [Mucilaginibacter boryungensis]|uniref:Endosialidase-like protein n=1 Tax=Mucilaginibacter boryungensis TaxID=768480 RepID=A0ABR9XLU5_9SPHI|nr:hypothetical protein [Mucilaginibacter boryungensis]MBE9668251.1 hypothetical protein [Mucilaginibacter boryungensis]
MEIGPGNLVGDAANAVSSIYYNRSTSSYIDNVQFAGSHRFMIGGLSTPSIFINSSGNVGIGTTNPPTVGNYGVLAINGRSPSQGGYLSLMNNGTELGSLAANSQLNIEAATDIVTQFYTGSTPTMQITAGGNMLLGKISQANASYLLDVNGKARCNEVVVNTTGADFVFQPGYKLNTLADIEKYVQANHHLPEIPSAQEMVADGLKVGEMNKLLLMKVEELTLYLIEKDKEVKQQQAASQTQQSQIDELCKQVETLLKKKP